MRFLLVTAGLAAFGLSPVLARAPSPAPGLSPSPPAVFGQNASPDLTTADNLPPSGGEAPGAGTIFLVPRSKGMPPGAVMLVPRSLGMRPGASGPDETECRLRAPHTDDHRACGGAMLRFRRGTDEAEIRCGADESIEICFQVAGPPVQRFFAAPTSTSTEGGTAQTPFPDDAVAGSGH